MWLSHFLSTGVNDICKTSCEFVRARQWDHHDNARNLVMAMCSEAGELVDVMAWTTAIKTAQELQRCQDKTAQELADIVIILVRLAKMSEIDLVRLMKNV